MANEKRLIEANEAIEILREEADVCNSGFTRNILEFVAVRVASIPTVDAVEVVHGRWEKAEHHGFLCCSECKDVYIDDTWVADGKWNYCPNCGADMRGETE